ncbi:MAG: helix-turn-helix transcriptional regulator [Cyanobacteriota bacterium]|nr:helix-turn-helix transcriptional regulator [Cyanobacteriota bacterium]
MDMEALRERAGLTRAEVADRLEISETSVRNWETGRTEPTMTPQRYQKLLQILQCTPKELANACGQSLDRRQKLKPGRPRKVANSNGHLNMAQQTIGN